jgi:hypothetical protein
MAACGHQAALVVTQVVDGTSTTIVRRRVDLTCGLASGHEGEHHDAVNSERWQGKPGERPTVLRHEDD